MKWILITIASAGIIGLSFITKTKPVSKQSKVTTAPVVVIGSYSPVAVLELFTSEGCSSCPSADNLLPQLIKLDANVVALSFHVDYWNRLGWTDPFSSNVYSDRQRHYAKQLNWESVYTPQLVVNGEYEFVGSNRSKAESAIKKVLKENTQTKLTVDNVKRSDDKLHFTVITEGDYSKTNLLAALVQKQVTMNVKAGENSGVKLSHTNVVRAFTMENAAAKNEFDLVIPKELAGNQWQLIVYAQQEKGLKITGAVVYSPDKN